MWNGTNYSSCPVRIYHPYPLPCSCNVRPEGRSPGAKNKEIIRKPLSGAKGWAGKSPHYKRYGFIDPLLRCSVRGKDVRRGRPPLMASHWAGRKKTISVLFPNVCMPSVLFTFWLWKINIINGEIMESFLSCLSTVEFLLVHIRWLTHVNCVCEWVDESAVVVGRVSKETLQSCFDWPITARVFIIVTAMKISYKLLNVKKIPKSCIIN